MKTKRKQSVDIFLKGLAENAMIKKQLFFLFQFSFVKFVCILHSNGA